MKLTGDLKKQVEMAESKDEISSIKLTVNDIVKQLSRFVSFKVSLRDSSRQLKKLTRPFWPEKTLKVSITSSINVEG